jgi:hypothetical protein
LWSTSGHRHAHATTANTKEIRDKVEGVLGVLLKEHGAIGLLPAELFAPGPPLPVAAFRDYATLHKML